MVIKIDVDGVIRNINETMCELYNRLFNEKITVEDIFDYNVENVFNKIKEKIGMTAVDYFFLGKRRKSSCIVNHMQVLEKQFRN
jgi:uncharacterized HAD superfamily protein